MSNKRLVINCSFATGFTPELEAVIKKLHNAGAVIVCASGNDPQASFFPASFVEYVISVGSLNRYTGKVSAFTSEPYETVAPGEYIRGVDGLGTSFASPHVAGIAACMLSKIPYEQIETKIIEWLREDE